MRAFVLFSLALALLSVAALLSPEAEAKRKKTFVYVVDNDGDQRVFGFALAKSGELTPLPGSPYAGAAGNGCGSRCQSLTYSRKRKMLVAGGRDGLTVWKVAKNGALSLVEGSPFGGKGVLGTRVVRRGKRVFVYGSAWRDRELVGLELAKDGTLTELPGSPFLTDVALDGMDAAKNLLVAMDCDDSEIHSLIVGKDGSLTPAPSSPVAPAFSGFVYNVQIDPKGKYVYAADRDSDLFAFSIDKKTAELTPLPGSPFTLSIEGLQTGTSISRKRRLFTTDIDRDATDDAVVLEVARDGTVTELGDVQSTGLDGGTYLHGWAPNGKVLVLASDGGENASVASFRVDRASGVLTPVDTEIVNDGDGDRYDINGIVFLTR